tara:strand:+ start:1911 stop:2216 length:306 start_codon:yes stop_codon:yes gene_type:complete
VGIMKRLDWVKRKDRHGFVYYVMQTPLETLVVEPWTESYCSKNGSNVYGSPMPYDMEHKTPLVWTSNKCATRFKDAESAKAKAFKLYKEKVVQTLEEMGNG